MPKRTIVHLGHPALRIPAEPVPNDEIQGAEIQSLIDDMIESMQSAEGVGLAAPQVGLALQLFVYLPVDERQVDREGESRALINPLLEPISGELIDDWEGCLSIPDLRGLVPRHPAVRVHAFDRHGKKVQFVAEGYEARIIQHEYDHLNGVIFLDRMHNLRSLAFSAEWEEYMTEPVDEEVDDKGGS